MPGPPSSGVQNANGQGVRVAELVAALSYAADLGLGQPLAHCMRQTVIALRLADLVGATQDEREATYYLGLMVSAYCHADAAEQARWFGDDIAFKADAFELLGKNTAQIVAFAVRRTGSHGTGVDRVRRIVTLPRSGMRQVMDFLATHARLSSRFAEQIGLDDVAVASFRQAYEQWDGKGVPLGLRGGEITLPSRLVQLAGPVEVYARLHGVEAARAAVRRSSGADLDPAVARLFREHAPHVLNGLDQAAEWTAILDAEPSLARRVDGADLDTVLEAMADLADLKSPQFAGHSRGVANLAAEAARVWRLPDADVTTVRRAGLLHDLGRLGVSNSIWDKPGPLTGPEREHVRIHPYLTDRMLAGIDALAASREIAARHHERLDGSGYPSGMTAASLSPRDRLLAAADAYFPAAWSRRSAAVTWTPSAAASPPTPSGTCPAAAPSPAPTRARRRSSGSWPRPTNCPVAP